MLTPQSNMANTGTNMDEVRRKMVEISPADEGLGMRIFFAVTCEDDPLKNRIPDTWCSNI